MRRVLLLVALLGAMLIPSAVSAAPSRCSVTISPSVGSPIDVYRISVSGLPVDPNGGGVEIQTVIRRLGTREGSVIWAFLMPGITSTFFDFHAAPPEEPPLDPLPAGKYHVAVSTPHLSEAAGCHVVGLFTVR